MDSGRVDWWDAYKALETLEEIRKGSEIGKLHGNGVWHFGKEIGYEISFKIIIYFEYFWSFIIFTNKLETFILKMSQC